MFDFKDTMLALIISSVILILATYSLVLVDANSKGPISLKKKWTKDVREIFKRRAIFILTITIILIVIGVFIVAINLRKSGSFDFSSVLDAIVCLFLYAIPFAQWLSDVPKNKNLIKNRSFLLGLGGLIVAVGFLVYKIHMSNLLVASLLIISSLVWFTCLLMTKPWGNPPRKLSNWLAILAILTIFVMILLEVLAFSGVLAVD